MQFWLGITAAACCAYMGYELWTQHLRDALIRRREERRLAVQTIDRLIREPHWSEVDVQRRRELMREYNRSA